MDRPVGQSLPRFDATDVRAAGDLTGNANLKNLAVLQNRDPFIHIYSADKDDWVKITYSEANMNALNSTSAVDELARIRDILKEKIKRSRQRH